MDFLPEILQKRASQAPTSLALVHDSRRLSYSQLYELASIVACNLHRHGLSPNQRVAMLLPNSPEAVALIYGTWLAGGVIVPLNPQAHAHEACTLAKHAEARFLIHEPAQRDIDATTAHSTVTAISITELLTATNEPSVSHRAAKSGDLAMLLYTSGTTGQPKAVMLSHGNILTNVSAIIEYLQLTEKDSVLLVLPFNYSYGNSVLHTHLAVGATIVIERNLIFPHAMVDTMVREKVTGFSGVPSTFSLLLTRVDPANLQLTSLRYITQAGAAMPKALLDQLRNALPQVRVFIMYGQTEATARLTYVPPERLDDKQGSVGIPIRGVELQIRDEHLRTLHSPDAGDIWVRGPSVMLGYWKDEAATREVLLDGWLKTGDGGYLDSDGFLFLVGRRSDIIKTGAHRVNPIEVEETIADIPGIDDAGVAGIDDNILGQSIAAYIVIAPGHDITIERIKAHCRERMAAYKVPKQVYFVDSLPRTASGKLRRIDLASVPTRQVTKGIH